MECDKSSVTYAQKIADHIHPPPESNKQYTHSPSFVDWWSVYPGLAVDPITDHKPVDVRAPPKPPAKSEFDFSFDSKSVSSATFVAVPRQGHYTYIPPPRSPPIGSYNPKYDLVKPRIHEFKYYPLPPEKIIEKQKFKPDKDDSQSSKSLPQSSCFKTIDRDHMPADHMRAHLLIGRGADRYYDVQSSFLKSDKNKLNCANLKFGKQTERSSTDDNTILPARHLFYHPNYNLVEPRMLVGPSWEKSKTERGSWMKSNTTNEDTPPNLQTNVESKKGLSAIDYDDTVLSTRSNPRQTFSIDKFQTRNQLVKLSKKFEYCSYGTPGQYDYKLDLVKPRYPSYDFSKAINYG